MMTSIAGGLNTGIWLCAVVLGATGSAIIVTVAASLPVSYTHLDVYKRQILFNVPFGTPERSASSSMVSPACFRF